MFTVALVASVMHSKLLYTAPVWASALDNHAIHKRLSSTQKGAAMIITSAYRIDFLQSCRYCRSLVENAEHTLFVCARRGAEREAIGRTVGAQLTPDTMVSLML